MVVSSGVDKRIGERRAPVPAAIRLRLYLYLLPLIGSPFLLLTAALFVLPSQWFALHSQNTYLVNLAYGAKLKGADCQVLVYGDSSALVGVDPSVIRERTGLKTCNIAEFQAMTTLNGTMLVDSYLKQNLPPRFLVFLYAPEDLDPQSQHQNGPFEAIVYRMRQPHRLTTLLFLARDHPNELATWVEEGLRFTLAKLFTKPALPAIQHLRDRTDGQFPMNSPARIDCEDFQRNAPPDKAWIAALRSKYGRGGTTVLVDATPLAPCDRSLSFFQQQLPGVIDNRMETLPVSDYVVEGRLHVNAEGAKLLSNMLADQLEEYLHPAALSTGAR
jgi:hypothetical protein